MSAIRTYEEYSSKQALIEAVQSLAIENHFELRVKASDKERYIVQCKSEGCSWRLYAKRIVTSTGAFVIRRLNPEHTCGYLLDCHNKEAGAKWISSKIVERLRETPSYSPAEIVRDIARTEHVSINYRLAWQAKEYARKTIEGGDSASYSVLATYYQKVKQTNPGKRRIRAEDIGRKKRAFRCSICNQLSHNRQTCRKPL